jgi:hypothetical protein
MNLKLVAILTSQLILSWQSAQMLAQGGNNPPSVPPGEKDAGCVAASAEFLLSDFRVISENTSILAVQFHLDSEMEVHIQANTEVVSTTGSMHFMTGFWNQDDPTSIWVASLRNIQIPEVNRWMNVGTNWATRLPAGDHKIYWNMLGIHGDEVQLGSGVMTVQAFPITSDRKFGNDKKNTSAERKNPGRSLGSKDRDAKRNRLKLGSSEYKLSVDANGNQVMRIIPNRVREIPLELLTIEGVKAYAAANNIRTIEELMDHLPRVLLSNYILMEDSHSRQQPSTRERPRIVLFLPDGRLFMGIATNPDSNGYHDVEMLESRDNKTWQLGALRLRPDAPPFIHTAGSRMHETSSCVDCHGASSRPIWGSYPTWPGAFADGAGHDLTAAQADALNRALNESDQLANVRLQKLNWLKRTGWSADDDFGLPDRYRNLANEAMNDAVGLRYIDNLWNRIAAAEHRDLFLLAHMFARHGFLEDVPGAAAARDRLAEIVQTEYQNAGLDYPLATISDKALLLLKFDVFDDLYLPKGLHQLPVPENEQQQFRSLWNYIAIYLGDLLTFRYVQELVVENPELELSRLMFETPFEGGNEYENIEQYRRANVRYMWELDLESRVSFLKTGDAPTIDLRHEHMFTRNLEAKIGPKLVEFARRKIHEYESERKPGKRSPPASPPKRDVRK